MIAKLYILYIIEKLLEFHFLYNKFQMNIFNDDNSSSNIRY